MYIERISIRNLKCFSQFELQLDLSGKRLPWTLILGDNATGKTALLRAIALGLCDESSASALMKESDEGYIRRGSASDAQIIIDLRRKRGGRTRYSIKTTITRVKSSRGSYERLRQVTEPKDDFPWEDIFAAAYGAGRGTAGTGDISGYSLINAAYNLFNYAEGLQNPELTIWRLPGTRSREQIKHLLADLTGVQKVDVTAKGIAVDGAWGRDMPLRDLADGYKSTILWVTDLLGWAIAFEKAYKKASEIEGIVLIDEIEQHLHPRWQEKIIDDLRRLFPHVQFIATSHSPLIASSVGQLVTDKDPDKLVYLELVNGKSVSFDELPSMRGWRVDQVLASRAFDYIVTTDTEMNELLRRASRLASKRGERSPSEELEYQDLKTRIASHLIPEGETAIEREIQAEFLQFMKKRIKSLRRKLSNSHD